MTSESLDLPEEARLALANVRVLEVGSGPALAYTGKLFADFGAELVKVEPPQGDAWRRMPPRLPGPASTRESALFAWLNTNKQSVTLELPAQDDGLKALARACDIVLDARALEAGIDVLSQPLRPASDPAAVTVDFTWFGADGPYRHYVGGEAACRSLAGAVHGSGPVQGPPHLPHDLQVGISAGLTAFTAAVAAWIGREQGARRLTLSIHECALSMVEMEAGLVQDGRHPGVRLGVNRFCGTHPAGIFETAEGWLGIFTHTLPQWTALCHVIGRPELAGDPRFASGADRMAHADFIDAILLLALRTRSAQAWFDELAAHKHPAVLVPTMGELLAQTVHRERGAFVPVTAGECRFEGPIVPLRLGAAGPRRGGRAPALGEHNLRYRDAPAPRLAPRCSAASPDVLPLSGMRILDLTMGWAGPLATRSLADLGAQVIKVESPAYPDWWRGANFTDAFYGDRLYEKNNNFNLMNRNKRGITLDLTQPEGRQVLLDLARECDAVIENYSAEVLPKLRLTYPVLCAENPRLVMVSMPAFGVGNAWSDVRAYGGTLEQASGLPLYTGHADHPPAMTSYAYGDPVGGLNAGAALLLALMVQRASGKGMHVNLSQVEAMLPMAAPFIIEQSVRGEVPLRQGNRHPMHAPHGCYPCAGDDAWVLISVTSDTGWRALCRWVGRPDLADDPTLATPEARGARASELDALVSACTRQLPADAVMTQLQAAGVAAGVVRRMADVLADPHLTARGYWTRVPRRFVGTYVSTTTPYRINGSPMPIRSASPTLGEHNLAVLQEVLGMDAAQVQTLAQKDIIGTLARRKPPRSSSVPANAVP